MYKKKIKKIFVISLGLIAQVRKISENTINDEQYIFYIRSLKFVNLKRAENWTLVNNEAGLVDIKDTHHTFPLLYYYLLPYIQEGKVLIRDEYKEFIKYKKHPYGS